MLTVKMGMRVSAVVDKMDLRIQATEINKEGKTIAKTRDQLGAELIMQIAAKAHKAEKEILDLIMAVKNCSQEEAENMDLVAFLKEVIGTPGMVDFFKSAVK